MRSDEAEAVLNEARETLRRTAHVTVERRDHGEYWSRPKQEAPAPVRHQPTVAEVEMQRSQDWTRFVDSRIERAIAERDDYWREVLAGLVSEVRKQLRSEFAEQLGLLRADVTIIERATQRPEHRDGGEIIDMVEPWRRRA
ncbi:hypothetical protein [Bradyrhizobium sp. RT4b]|uniref:hypothetical protein n=1 Tax=Bradyrhizobium sp. RT4b TaxID=3156379 RepID=UPI003393C539